MAVVARSLAYPRPSMLSWSAALPLEEDLPLQGRPVMPLLDALPGSPMGQNLQALQRRVAVCLRGLQLHEFSSHGLCTLLALGCAYHCP